MKVINKSNDWGGDTDYDSPLYSVSPDYIYELRKLLKESLASFKLTQDPSIYPEGHWSRKAENLLNEK
jgi:hypothetical protein